MIIKIDISLIKNLEVNNSLNVQDNKFSQLMHLYSIAMRSVEEKINEINIKYREIYKTDLINHIVCRVKQPESIIKKMKKRNYDLTYQNMIENINDIAGVRIVCTFKNNVFEVADMIRNLEYFRVIKEKDYITHPKKTGYSSYHMIVEIPIQLDGVEVYAKVEIQIRTMAMDFWSTLEHEIKYKSTKNLTSKISKELVFYAKIIRKLDNKLLKIHKKQSKKNLKIVDE